MTLLALAQSKCQGNSLTLLGVFKVARSTSRISCSSATVTCWVSVSGWFGSLFPIYPFHGVHNSQRSTLSWGCLSIRYHLRASLRLRFCNSLEGCPEFSRMKCRLTDVKPIHMPRMFLQSLVFWIHNSSNLHCWTNLLVAQHLCTCMLIWCGAKWPFWNGLL